RRGGHGAAKRPEPAPVACRALDRERFGDRIDAGGQQDTHRAAATWYQERDRPAQGIPSETPRPPKTGSRITVAGIPGGRCGTGPGPGSSPAEDDRAGTA